MTVYIDDAFLSFRNMQMCHMIADTTNELLEMVDKIGVQRKWIQHPGQPKREHFDICASKRALAIKAGAIPVSFATLAHIKRNCVNGRIEPSKED
jgi:hypothetical protein